jgi:hypothetical protein
MARAAALAAVLLLLATAACAAAQQTSPPPAYGFSGPPLDPFALPDCPTEVLALRNKSSSFL